MAGNARAPSTRTAPKGLVTARNGLGPERVIEIQRARLLAAMVEVNGEHGAGSVTVAHVVERAGVSRRTFYELFEDREDCFLAAFDEGVGRASRHVLDSYDSNARWAGTIRTALVALLSFLDVERGVGRLLIVGSPGAGTRALERRRQVLGQMVALIDEGRRESKAGDDLPGLTAEGIVGGVLSVLHARLLDPDGGSLLELTNPLMSTIVLPYRGSAAARRELRRPAPAAPPAKRRSAPADPLRDVEMRLTYRTVRVLTSVAALGGRGSYPSNREIGLASGIQDQGQISKLLTRLAKLGLIENTGAGQARGAPNAWMLTGKGQEIERAIGEQAGMLQTH
jgi:AcrR family transcriptional regulator